MNKTMLACLITLAVLATGCVQNNYEVTLTPRGGVIERTLVFYCSEEGSSPAAASHHDCFDPRALASIAAFYPKTGVTNDGDRHTVSGEFTGALPGDIGGAGWHTNLSTSLGDAGFYVERFRGSDDLVGIIRKRLQAADQLTDLVIGWSKTQFKSEPGFKKLNRFLDQDFRQDLKNFSLYYRMDDVFKSRGPSEESLVRFGQYLIERGYVRPQEAPRLILLFLSDDDAALCRLLQRLLAEKLRIGGEQPMPRSLVFMGDSKAVENSWSNYLAGTDFYRTRLRSWEKDHITNAKAQKPDPLAVAEDLISTLVEIGDTFGQDRLTVRLSLSAEPVRTNGKWDGTKKQVVWKSGLAENTQISRLPVFCYADWVAPREDFQKDHLGSVSLAGEELLKYCLWRTSLEDKKAAEWEQFLTNLKPGADVANKLNSFRFAGELEQINSNGLKRASDMGKEMIKAALRSSR
jgi:hypothetical protein